MSFLRELWKFRSTVILVVTPLFFLIFFVLFPPEQYREASCAYVISVMAVFWITEVVPLAVTSLLPLVLYPLLGVVSASKVSVQYLKDVNVLFLGGLTVAVAVEHWNLHKRVALKVLCWVGAKPRWLLFGFMVTTAFLSMWISNVATTAMMVPIAQAVLEELDEQDKERSRSDSGVGTPRDGKLDSSQGGGFLATSFSGNQDPMADKRGNIATPQALGKNGVVVNYHQVAADDSPIVPESTFELPPIEVTGPDTPTPAKSPKSPNSGSHIVVDVATDDPASSTAQLIGSAPVAEMEKDFNEKLAMVSRKKGLAKALTVCVCYAANIGGTATLTGTGPNLIVAGQFKTSYPEGPEVDFGSWCVFAFPGMILFLFICWLWLQYLFLSTRLSDLLPTFKKTNKMSSEEQKMHDVIRRQYNQLGTMSFAESSVLVFFTILALLWLTRDPGFFPGWGKLPIFKEKYVSDATVAMTIAFLLFIFPSQPPNCFLRGSPEKRGPSPPLLTWSIVQKKMAWNVILLLGGGFAMALGAQESGLSKLIGEKLQPLHVLPPFWANVVCLVVVSAVTQCTSNTATATVFLPILAELGEVLKMNPLLLMLPSTLITSYAFMLPVSTPPNAIAYSYDHLTTMDMVKAGSFLNVIGLFIAMFSVYTFGSLAFNLHEPCPPWLNSTLCTPTTFLGNTTSSPFDLTLTT